MDPSRKGTESTLPPEACCTTIVGIEQALFLQQELQSLLDKGVTEYVPLLENDLGFYNQYFLVPKKHSRLLQILDFHAQDHALKTYRFKMLMDKLIMSQIKSKDWFVTIDLKDAYFQHLVRAQEIS